MRSARFTPWVALAVMALSQVAEADEASFTATGAAGLKFSGKTQEISAAHAGENVVVKVLLKHLETGISLRDKHMTEKYLQVDQYPEAVLTVPFAQLKLPEEGEVSAEATGTFSLHGRSKPLTFTYKASRGKDGLAVNGTLRLDLRDFAIEIPSYLGVTVKPNVNVAATFKLAAR
ncbi:MAG: YceI family protein [Myxococcaceae bacterium]